MNNQRINSLMQQAIAALNQGAYRELQQLCREILSLDRNRADAWFFMSIVAEAGGQPGHGLQFVERALQIDPRHVEYLSQKAKLHSLHSQYPEALAAANQAVGIGSDRAIVLDTLGVTYTRLGSYEAARELLQKAVDREPDNPQFQFNLGSAEQFLGNIEAARNAYLTAISHKPDFSRAYWALSELEKNEPEPGRLEQLLDLYQRRSSPSTDQLYLSHAISREYEKLGNFDQAFAYLLEGKNRHKAEIRYTVEPDIALIDTIRETFARVAVKPADEDPLAGRAIFITGMPRSGTTLVERILSSHSQVESLGELQDFPRAIKQLADTPSPLVLDQETILQAVRADMGQLGRNYARRLADRVSGSTRFIDKLPLNFLSVGFILAALPDARIICLRRNALDTCLSNFRQLFALNFSYYNYHYDLSDTARFYVAFDRLMGFWQSQFPGRFFQLHYEELLEAPEQEVRAIFQYLDLEFEGACLEFHKHGGAVATASASQVRQPFYRSSVARWKKYEKQLAPAMEILEAAGIPFR